MIDEPNMSNRRTDAGTEAANILSHIPGSRKLDEQQRGYIRDALVQAFDEGEHQENCRAIRILAIARDKATSAETRAALVACLRLLAPED